jgi:hypothetical protein
MAEVLFGFLVFWGDLFLETAISEGLDNSFDSFFFSLIKIALLPVRKHTNEFIPYCPNNILGK